MTDLRDCTDPATWWPHLDEAVRSLASGALAVVPTDTVYGIAADAFTPDAVQRLLDAKGRGRNMPPPVLIADARTMEGLAVDIPAAARALAERFWPGPLTLILGAQPSLAWDLGETEGTVALRVPDHELTLALLRRTGPLAVSSANRSGRPAALSAAEADEQLGSAVRVYLDGGPVSGGVPSTIVDATSGTLRIVRGGALSAAELAVVAPELGPDPTTEGTGVMSATESPDPTEPMEPVEPVGPVEEAPALLDVEGPIDDDLAAPVFSLEDEPT